MMRSEKGRKREQGTGRGGKNEEGGVERELDEVVPSERGSEGLFSDVANDPLVTVVEPLCR